jgi:hypothetical protein
MKEKSVGLLIGLIIGLTAGTGGYWAATSILRQPHSTPTTINTLPHAMNLNTTKTVEITTTVSAIQSYSGNNCDGRWSTSNFPSTQLTLTVSDPQTCSFSVVFASAYNYNITVDGNVYTVSANSGSIVSTINATFVFTPPESLGMDSYSYNNSTSVALYIRNSGSAPVSLGTYYIKDSSGDQWSDTAYTGGPIAPSTALAVYIGIPNGGTSGGTGNGCAGNCVYSGTPSAFNGFLSGYSYTVILVTAYNNHFSFTITK